MAVWEKLNASQYVVNNEIKAWRVVEDQSTSFTRKFVDTTAEHDLLEELIENAKPQIKYLGDEHYFKDLHYLLKTPFRYPPLKWGSRFGTRFERALLYASIDMTTALSEKAFYKFAFLKASDGALGGKTISYTAFRLQINSQKTLDLSELPFNQFKNYISSKTSYQFSQDLGKEMRKNNIESFQYVSARCGKEGINIGVYAPSTLQNNQKLPSTFQDLNCYFTKEIVEFSIKHQVNEPKYVFPKEMFLVNGSIPMPPGSG